MGSPSGQIRCNGFNRRAGGIVWNENKHRKARGNDCHGPVPDFGSTDRFGMNAARLLEFERRFLSDPNGKVGQLYGAFDSKYKLDNRTIYVIAPGGKISYVAAEFQEVDPQAYVSLGEAVGKTMGDAKPN